jgi:hypothetical protein
MLYPIYIANKTVSKPLVVDAMQWPGMHILEMLFVFGMALYYMWKTDQ